VTAQGQAKAQGKRGWRSVGITTSPLISSPARLLKLLAPNMAYISKEDCNPNLHGCEVIDVRVPLGKEQAKLYGFWLNRAGVGGLDAVERVWGVVEGEVAERNPGGRAYRR
jgi:hypothetical protein